MCFESWEAAPEAQAPLFVLGFGKSAKWPGAVCILRGFQKAPAMEQAVCLAQGQQRWL